MFVGASDRAPHRAMMGPDKTRHKYFRRRQHSSGIMTHDELADMFGRRPHPHVIPEVILTYEKNLKVHVRGNDAQSGTGFHLSFDLWNLGRGLAKWATVEFRVYPPFPKRAWEYRYPNVAWSDEPYDIHCAGPSYHEDPRGEYELLQMILGDETAGILHSGTNRRYLRMLILNSHMEKLEDHPEGDGQWRIRWKTMAEEMPPIEGEFPLRLDFFDRVSRQQPRPARLVVARWEAHPLWGEPETLIESRPAL